jgi:hypothetical protein
MICTFSGEKKALLRGVAIRLPRMASVPALAAPVVG